MEELDEILEEYAYESEIFSASYELMGQMLDREYVKNRLEMLELFDVYIYGIYQVL